MTLNVTTCRRMFQRCLSEDISFAQSTGYRKYYSYRSLAGYVTGQTNFTGINHGLGTLARVAFGNLRLLEIYIDYTLRLWRIKLGWKPRDQIRLPCSPIETPTEIRDMTKILRQPSEKGGLHASLKYLM